MSRLVRLCLLSQRGVRRRVEKAGMARSIAQHDLRDPTFAVRVGVDQLGSRLEAVIAPDDFAAEWRIDLGDALRRLDLAERCARVDTGPDLGKAHEHDIAERFLRVVGNAEPDPTVADVAYPLVLGGVA